MRRSIESRWLAGGAVLLAAGLFAGCGGGSGGSGSGGVAPVVIRGVAARGAPIVGAAMLCKDRHGVSAPRTLTGADGGFAIDVTGLTAPFLCKCDDPDPAKKDLFTIAERAGTVNCTPLTDLICENFFDLSGRDASTEFDTLSDATDLPTEAEVAQIEERVEAIVAPFLRAEGIDPGQFDLITSPFDVNAAGVDDVLDRITGIAPTPTGETLTIKDPGPDGIPNTADDTTTTSTVTIDAIGDKITVDTTVIDAANALLSSYTVTDVVPTSTFAQDAVAGIQAALGAFKTVVNVGGVDLTDADILPLFDVNFRDGGFDAKTVAARLADHLRGRTLADLAIDTLVGFDEANQVVSVKVPLLTSVGGVTSQEDVLALALKRQADGSWLFFGDQTVAEAEVECRMRTDVSAGGVVGPRKEVRVEVQAPAGTIASVVVSDPSGLAAPIFGAEAALQKFSRSETFNATSTAPLTVLIDSFEMSVEPAAFPAPGTLFTVTVTPVAGPAVVYYLSDGACTTESTALAVKDAAGAAVGTTLADAHLGGPLTLTWTLPQSFAVAGIGVSGFVFSQTGESHVDAAVAPTATGVEITLPLTANGATPDGAVVELEIRGANGEMISAQWRFGM